MKEFMKKGISAFPVVNEILFFVLLAHDVIELVKNWCKKSKSSTNKEPDNESPGNGDEKK